jgi:hypothetical protein
MPQRRSSSPRAELDDISRRQADVADVCARIFKALDPLLQKEGIHELNLERMIFSRVGKGVVVHLPVKLGEKVTKRDLYTGAHAVGVLANTTTLLDRLSETALGPGVYLVKVRPISKNIWAFDFVQADSRKVLSTPADLVDPGRFAFVPDDQVIGFLVGSVGSIDVLVGPDPDALLPYGPGTNLVCCISFLYWTHCFVIGLA